MISRNQIAGLVTAFTLTAFILGICVGLSQRDIEDDRRVEPAYPEAPLVMAESAHYMHYETTYHPSWDLPTTTVRWVRDPIEVEKQLELFEANNPYMDAHAVSVHYPRECIIYAMEPAHSADQEATWRLGHEMLHCFRGAYHD